MSYFPTKHLLCQQSAWHGEDTRQTLIGGMNMNSLMFLKWRWHPPTPTSESICKCGALVAVLAFSDQGQGYDRSYNLSDSPAQRSALSLNANCSSFKNNCKEI